MKDAIWGLSQFCTYLFVHLLPLLKCFSEHCIFLWLKVTAKKLLFSQVYDALD